MPESQNIFNPSRLTVVRKRMGLTKVELARRAGFGLRTIAGYESGEYIPSDDALATIASLSQFPIEFFFGESLEEPQPEAVSFRSLARMSSCVRDTSLSHGALALHFNKWIDERFDLPKADIPDLGHERSPEAAAESLRQHWAIGELPIRNMVHLLEARGVRIFSLAVGARELDAFSMWHDKTPFVFLNSYKSSEHSRYDAAHELAHLVLHRHGGPRGRGAEREADLFASAFLMPKGSINANASPFPTLDELILLKRIWNVSVAALNCRLHAVGMTTDWQYRSLCIQIAQQSYRTSEPNSAPREMSQVLPKIFASLHEEGVTRSQVARELGIPQSELEQLLFGLALASLEGGGKGSVGSQPARLSLVEKH